MRIAIALILTAGLAGAATAEPNVNLMDLNEGLWSLSGGPDTEGCDVTLGDRPTDHGARMIDDAGDCRNIVPEMASATAWRIDEPSTFVFLSDTGKVLMRLEYDKAQGEFKANDEGLTLTLSPLD